MRTLAVFVGGVVLGFALSVALELLLDPDGGQWIAKAFNAPPTSPQWGEISRQLERSGKISLYVINPLVGLAVGIFVGLLQKNRALIVTASCLIPDFLYGVLTDHAKLWAHSILGIARYALHSSLPLAVALAAAALCHRFMNNRRRLSARLREQSAT
jgi:hypothetical protein